MILFNFAHPLTERQQEAITQLTHEKIERIITATIQFDNTSDFVPQLDDLMSSLVEGTKLTPAQWQSESFVVNLPGFSNIAALILAEFHGRMGYFPRVVRMRPVGASTPPQFEVAEILDLRTVRDEARKDRIG